MRMFGCRWPLWSIMSSDSLSYKISESKLTLGMVLFSHLVLHFSHRFSSHVTTLEQSEIAQAVHVYFHLKVTCWMTQQVFDALSNNRKPWRWVFNSSCVLAGGFGSIRHISGGWISNFHFNLLYFNVCECNQFLCGCILWKIFTNMIYCFQPGFP